jgi:hypothetical protein
MAARSRSTSSQTADQPESQLPTAFHEATKEYEGHEESLYRVFFVPFVFLRTFVMSCRR